MKYQIQFVLTFILLSYSFAHAQKLPNVQKDEVRAPQNIKIDGKLTEWDDTFQAHNTATDIFYTIANDDDNLYLVVHAEDNMTINRIVGKGLTLNIQKGGKKDIKSRMSFTYPAFEGRFGIVFNFGTRKGVVQDTFAAAKQAVIKNANLQIGQKAKNIAVAGVPGIDSLLSVYNETGIRAQSSINSSKFYNMEIAIPLKYLELSVAGDRKFTYQIIVNGMVNMFSGPITITPGPGSTPEMTAKAEENARQMMSKMSQSAAPTDFWGEYTLVKK